MHYVKRTVVLTLVAAACTASAQGRDLKEQMATVINVGGQLCAKVLTIKRGTGKDVYEVECVRYRDGTGRATYEVNALTGRVK